MDEVILQGAYTIATLFELYVIAKFMSIFLDTSKDTHKLLPIVYSFRFFICTLQYVYKPYFLLNMIISILTLGLIACCYAGRKISKMITVVLLYMCLFAAEAVMAGVLSLVHVSVIKDGHNGDAFSYIGISIILWIIYKLIHIFTTIHKEVVLPRTVDIIIILLSSIVFIMETILFLQTGIHDSVKLISIISMLLVLFLIIYMYDIISKYHIGKVQLELIEREKNYYVKQTALLEERNQAVKSMQHDMKNHLYAIESLLSGDNQAAKEYINKLTGKLEKNECYSHTGNVALDSIINYKLSEAKREHAEITCQIVIPEDIHGDMENLVTIVGNLLDNANEAIRYLKKEKYIYVKIRYKQGVLFVDIKNSYDGMLHEREGEFVTKKKDSENHGIGLKSVEAAVEYYNGTINFDYDEKEFRVHTILYM